MKRKFIISIAFLAIIVCPAFGMIKRTTVAPKVTSSVGLKIASVPSISQLTRPYSSPSVSTFPTYDYNIAQNKYQWNQDSDKKIKWYNKKSFKKAFRDNTVILIGSFLLVKLMATLMSEDAAIKDTELYEVFEKMKKDYGIKEKINLRIIRPEYDNLYSGNASYTPFLNNEIFISSRYKQWDKSHIIHVIAHELEHYRQFAKKEGSYSPGLLDFYKPFRLEIGADAAAADYQYCYKCLGKVASRSRHKHDPQETRWGYITTPYGYFSNQDYKLYENRAKEACALCPAHKTGTHENLTTPLKDFLPPTVK